MLTTPWKQPWERGHPALGKIAHSLNHNKRSSTPWERGHPALAKRVDALAPHRIA